MALGPRGSAICALTAALSVLCASCSDDASSGPGGRRPGGARKGGGAGNAGVEFDDNFQRIRIEAEDAVTIDSDDAHAKVGGKLMRIVADPDASGGKCIEIPDEAGMPNPPAEREDRPRHARAVYKFSVQAAGNYTFWCRRKWLNACADTLAVRFDQEGQPRDAKTEFLFGGSDSKPVRWAWSPVAQSGQPREFPLAAGEHTMEVLNLEDGPRFDVILLTDDPGYVPQGMEK